MEISAMKNKELIMKNYKKECKGLFLACGLWLMACSSFASEVKEPNVAGQFYPSNKEELKGVILRYIDQAKQEAVEGSPVLLISPHAGYVYSGPVAAYGYAGLKGKKVDTVIILAASHFFPFKGISVYKEGIFKTPLGDITIDSEFASRLIKENTGLISDNRKVFEQEHSLEVQLPFLQVSLEPGFKIVPVIFGEADYADCVLFSKYLEKMARGKNVLVIASTDLSHYRTYDEALYFDKKTIESIRNFEEARIQGHRLQVLSRTHSIRKN
ncbi:MAG TPA: AmmeMemoRadiSam system protein B [Candidatus Omnitrophota bacterium]|nr:AmmeMemoRadiSam system protein B [Candidatus Omnitrophota bacterium]